MELDEKSINRFAQRAGIWAGVSFILTLLVLSAAVWLVRAVFDGIQSAAEASQAREAEAKDAVVSDKFKADAAKAAAALAEERDQLPRGKTSYLNAKRSASANVDALLAEAQTERERSIQNALASAKLEFEICADYVYDSYGVEKASHCIQQLPDSAIQEALVK